MYYKPEDYEMWKDLVEDLKRLINQRTGLKPDELECPREKSDMTPCLARDGWTAMLNGGGCVGCGEHIHYLMKTELEKHEETVRKKMTEKYADKVDFT